MKLEFLADKTEFIDEVAEVIYNEWGRLIPGNLLENTRKKLKLLLNKEKIPLTIICLDNHILTGLYSLMLNDQANTRNLSPWLGTVYVKPEYRNMGKGTELVKHSLSLTKKLNSRVLYLHTSDRQAMYARVGFKPIYETEVNGKKVTVMSKFT